MAWVAEDGARGGAARGWRVRLRAAAPWDGWAPPESRLSAVRRELSALLTLEVERGALFLLIPVLLGLGAALYFGLRFEPGWWTVGALVAAPLGGLALARSPVLRYACLGVFVVGTGVAAGKWEAWRASTPMLGQAVVTRVTGRVVRADLLPNGRMRVLLDVRETARPTLRFAPRRVRLTGKAVAGVRAGATVTGLARLAAPSGPIMPGGYDFAFASFFAGVGANGFFLGPPSVLPGNEAPTLGDRIERARDAMAARIRAAIGGAEGEVAAALIVGVRGGIPEAVNEDLRRTGLAHILSISGVHMALVAACVMGGARALLALLPGFSARHSTKKYAAAAGFAAVSAYALFSGADVAALRSYLMLAVMLLAVLADRSALSMRNLAIAAILILLWTPHEVAGPSFQMSFAATAALIAAYSAWSERARARVDAQGTRPKGWLSGLGGMGGRAVLGLAATSVIAGAATGVFAVYHFQRFAPLSLPANLAVMPVVSFVVMPFGLLGMIAMPFGLEQPFFSVMGWGLAAMNALAAWFARHSPVDAVGAIPFATLALTALGLGVAAVSTTRLRWLALVPFAAAALWAPLGTRPVALISEDGRLVSVAGGAGTLAVNAARGGGFTLENWARALDGAVTRPASPAQAGAFSCDAAACRFAETPAAPSIAIAAAATPLEPLCRTHALTIQSPQPTLTGRSDAEPHEKPAKVSPPPSSQSAKSGAKEFGSRTREREQTRPPRGCGPTARGPRLVLRRDLGLRGAAAVYATRLATGWSLRVVHAVPEPTRPWQTHRRFSRAARGLPDPEARRSGPPTPVQSRAGAKEVGTTSR